ncbi:MAG: class I SAM-dependent methyltransferase [Chloroflexi bacterium]|nr:class I SAM-dependent methyltransferase [Chloroflexota bacterium]MDA1297464.1 class I SAM-dependent methyltransferase [Chloroflexota bacterium]
MKPLNKTQRLQQWFESRPRWDHASYGEFMHVGANQTIFRIVLQGLEITPDTKILDTACAVGGNARWLASLYGCQVYGNDIDADALAVAMDLAEIENISDLCTFVEARADNLPFDDGMFDLVISTDVFDIAEVIRVLKPGGHFVVSSLIEDQDATFKSLANDWGMVMEAGQDVTSLAFAFHRAKESEAQLLLQADMIPTKALVDILNENISPYTRGGRHFLMRLRKRE